MKLLDGTELAGYIQERQAKQVRHLKQAFKVAPKLAIVQTVDDPVISTYIRMKSRYGDDVGIDVQVLRSTKQNIHETITSLNSNADVHGIIVQLPLDDEIEVESVLNLVSPQKDVDGLSDVSGFTPATAQAIDWLVTGYNIDLKIKRIAIVGNGRLVGAPLSSLWKSSGYNVTVYDEHSKNISKGLRRASVVVSATGVPGLVTADMLQPGAVVVDAATSAEHGKIVGDIAADVRSRTDLTITPEKGGVGPLTVASLFENVIRAAQNNT